MTVWDDAGAAIDAAFVDPEPLIYSGAGLVAEPIFAIRSDNAAPDFAGEGRTLRQVTYEVAQSDLPMRPDKSNTFTHRAHNWKVEDVTPRDDLAPPKWELVVIDLGEIE